MRPLTAKMITAQKNRGMTPSLSAQGQHLARGMYSGLKDLDSPAKQDHIGGQVGSNPDIRKSLGGGV